MTQHNTYNISYSSTILAKYKKHGFLLIAALVAIASGCKKADAPIVKPEINVAPALPNTAYLDNITGYKKFKANHTSPYDLVLIGDSYIQLNYFNLSLKNKLLQDGGTYGGPGYCSFGRWDNTDISSIDGSIDPNQLTFTYDPVKWAFNQIDAIGPCGDVKSNVDNANITVTTGIALNSLTIIYEKHAGAGDFRYRLNGGAWTTVSAEGAEPSIANTVVSTVSAGTNATLEIESLKAGQRFCGVVGRTGSNALTVHKAGMAGGIAVYFAQNDLWRNSVRVLDPKGVVILFGTNEMAADVSPENLRENVQLIIDKVKQINPDVDILLVCPPQTKFEKEEPKKYKIEDYGNVLYKLAAANKAGFVNFATIFPAFSQKSVDDGYMDEDRQHPGTKGSELIAQTIYDAFSK